MKKVYLIFILSLLFMQSLRAQIMKANLGGAGKQDQYLLSASLGAGSMLSSSSLSQETVKLKLQPNPWTFYAVLNAVKSIALVDKAVVSNDVYRRSTLTGFEFMGGYRFSYFTGIGIGLGLYDAQEKLHSHMPIFLELRNWYYKSRFTPYTALRIGYAFSNGRASIPAEFQSAVVSTGGVMFDASVGLTYYITTRTAVNLFVGYNGLSEKIEIHYPIHGTSVASITRPNFLHQFKVGVGFSL